MANKNVLEPTLMEIIKRIDGNVAELKEADKDIREEVDKKLEAQAKVFTAQLNSHDDLIMSKMDTAFERMQIAILKESKPLLAEQNKSIGVKEFVKIAIVVITSTCAVIGVWHQFTSNYEKKSVPLMENKIYRKDDQNKESVPNAR